jgi:uncharacterized membrane protein
MPLLDSGMKSLAGTWLAGLLALLPLALTAAVLAWAFGLVNRLIGPGSMVGGLFARLGYPFSNNPGLAYLIGTAVLIGAIYLLGLAVQSGLKGPLTDALERTVRRIPIIGSIYDLSQRFVGILDRKEGADIAAMSPVWCFFGGEGVAALALAPSASTVDIEGRGYRAVLVPTAPVPFGGALLYVPAAWVRPANIGVDQLTAIYVSMGITPPSPRGA